MRKRQLGVRELQAAIPEFELGEERRRERQGMNRGTNVVFEAGQGQLLCARPASDRVASFENAHGQADAC
jgi:hypothetical protein